MAKSAQKKKAKGPAAKGPAAKQTVEQPELLLRMEQELQRGNYAGVQKLAAEVEAAGLPPKARERAGELVLMVKTDPATWAIGVGAVALVLLVAAATLGG